MDVLQAGSYLIYTDTTNGIYFRATGIFSTAGLNTVRLKGYGTPLAMGITNFVVTYGLTECTIAVPVLPVGGASPASFTLSSGAGGECMGASVSGTYTEAVVLTASNQVVVNVNVTAIGTYNISTAATNGITFSGTGAFLATGPATITLTATGTPTAAGTTNIPVTAGASSCSFPVTVVGPAAFTVNCGSAVVNGTYEEGVTLGGANAVTLQVNVTTPGGYSITGSVNGMTFMGSGNFTATGPQSVTLAGSGTPAADGTFNVPISAGSAPCSFSVTVNPGTAPPVVDWKFTEGGTTYQGATESVSLEVMNMPPFGNISMLTYNGETTGGDAFSFTLADLAGGIQNNETYGSSFTGANTIMFFDYDGGPVYTAGMAETGVTLSVKVTSHNTASKTVQGTFSGTVKDGAGTVKTITNGTFKGTYP